MAVNLNLDGVYIPSFNRLIKNYKIGAKKKFVILGSAHNVKDLIIKQKQKVDTIFISPLFKTKKNTSYLGIIRFNLINKKNKNKIIALGGINENNKKMLSLLDINGYAAISYFNK